jgi:mRNA interferase RelE/StbE
MTYKLIYTRRAARDISKLQRGVKQRIKRSLERYARDPFFYAKKMADPTLGTYRFRIGEYRVIFDIEGDELTILRLGHRSKIYRS